MWPSLWWILRFHPSHLHLPSSTPQVRFWVPTYLKCHSALYLDHNFPLLVVSCSIPFSPYGWRRVTLPPQWFNGMFHRIFIIRYESRVAHSPKIPSICVRFGVFWPGKHFPTLPGISVHPYLRGWALQLPIGLSGWAPKDGLSRLSPRNSGDFIARFGASPGYSWLEHLDLITNYVGCLIINTTTTP